MKGNAPKGRTETPSAPKPGVPVLTPDEAAEVRRLYREQVRLVHRIESNQAKMRVLGDELDDKYGFIELDLYLDFQTARFVTHPTGAQSVTPTVQAQDGGASAKAR